MEARERKWQIEEFASAVESRLSSWPRLCDRGLRVAIVGSGPLGLSCARFLAQCGYEVVVYESQEGPGGLMRDEVRDSAELLAQFDEMLGAMLEEAGIQVVCGYEVDSVELAAIAVWFDVVYIATGTSLGRFGLKVNQQRAAADSIVHAGDFPNVIVNGPRLDNPSDAKVSVEVGEAVAFEIESMSKRTW